MKFLAALCFVFLLVLPASAEDSSGVIVWANASDDTTDTGQEACGNINRQPNFMLVKHECLTVFVPGSATEVACDVDMTDAGTDSDYYLVLCR